MMKGSRLRRSLALVFFSGLMVVAPLSAQKWNRYGPGTRSQASAVYDPATNKMFVFAGQHAPTNVNFNDMWVLGNAIPSSPAAQENLEWSRLVITGKAPGVRFGHSAVYNQTSNRLIVFGGATGFPGPCVNDLWVVTHLNSQGGAPAWKQFAATGTAPPVREGQTAVYDSTNNKLIIFGGTDCAGNYYNDLWILSNADGSTVNPSWAQITPIGTAPSARTQATAVYDSVNNVMTVYGGGTSATNVFADVWTLTNANGVTGTPTWTLISAKGTLPAGRVGQSAIYDATNNRMTIYGGANKVGKVLNDGWVLTFANNIGGSPTWSTLVQTAAGPFRKSHTAIYDHVSNDMVIFGGDSQLPQTFTDDHALILTKANGLTAGTRETQ
jgi:hypothetical protein